MRLSDVHRQSNHVSVLCHVGYGWDAVSYCTKGCQASSLVGLCTTTHQEKETTTATSIDERGDGSVSFFVWVSGSAMLTECIRNHFQHIPSAMVLPPDSFTLFPSSKRTKLERTKKRTPPLFDIINIFVCDVLLSPRFWVIEWHSFRHKCSPLTRMLFSHTFYSENTLVEVVVLVAL